MKSYKKFNESRLDWNKVLKKATWSSEKYNDVYYIDLDNVKLAIENGADVDSCGTLSWAVRNKNFDVVKYMLENGADVNYQDNDCKWTPLMTVSDDFNGRNELEIAKILIDYGADPLIGNFQNFNTMDILEHDGELKNATFGYNHSSAEGKKIKDEIYKYIMQNIVDKNPEQSINYLKYLTDEQKEKYKPYIDANKYNL
jgi:ankyrin repeat protein